MRHSLNTYLLTCVTDRRRPSFTYHSAAIALETLHLYAQQKHYRLHAAVIMPDPLHALLTPAPDHAIERCAGMIKGGISFRLREQIKGLWQEGYDDRRLRDDQQFVTAIEYIRRNPERRGLKDWPFLYVEGPGAKAPIFAGCPGEPSARPTPAAEAAKPKPKPATPNLQPQTRNPKPATPNPQPQTYNPKPTTPNPRAQTWTPQPQI